MRWLSVLLLTAVALLVPAGPARAHVEPEQAAPAPDEVVTEAFARVTLTFGGPLLEGGEHAVGLFGPDGRELDDRATVAESDRVVSTGVASLPAEGTYTVRWRIFAADGDQQDGAYSFTYAGPAAPPAEPAATATQPGGPTATEAGPTPKEPTAASAVPTAASTVPTPTREAPPQAVEPSSELSSEPSDVLGIALAAIVGLAVAAGAVALLTRRGRP